MDFFDKQAEIDKLIVQAALESTPPDWDDFNVVARSMNSTSSPIEIELINHGSEEKASANPELCEAMIRLMDLYKKDSRPLWKSANYRICFSDQECWNYNAEYTYDS
ncbi:MAG: hypothetical protein KDI71_07835 [Xanthomonadales bacterium]|nr:hypothetical protein [Xanthomonadales bacterium]